MLRVKANYLMRFKGAKTANRQNKIAGRIEGHKNDIVDALIAQFGWQILKAAAKDANGAGSDCGCKK